MKVLYSQIEDQEQFNINNLLTPAKDFLPQWFADIKADYHNPNVRTCASFMELFDRSLVYRSPGDWWVEFEGNEMTSGGDEASQDHIGLGTHTLFEGTDQLGNFDKGFHNLKIDSNLIIKSEKGRIDAVFMDVFYWDTRPRFRAAQGVLPILDNKEVQLNVNLWVPKFIDRIEIKKGDPIAMLYFPMGIPILEEGKVEITEREHEGGDYIKHLNKCPFHH
jgi:hypothetical protein